MAIVFWIKMVSHPPEVVLGILVQALVDAREYPGSGLSIFSQHQLLLVAL